MAPTAVLILLTDHTSDTMTSPTSNNKNNNIMNLGGSNSGSSLANFGVYRQTPVGLSELSIRTLVPVPISAEPYRKALIAKLFFHQILSLMNSTSATFYDLLATVAAYFDIITGSAETKPKQQLCLSLFLFLFSAFQLSSVLSFLIHPESLLRFRISITAR